MKNIFLCLLCLFFAGCVMHTGTVSTVGTHGRHGIYGAAVTTGNTFLPSGRDMCYQFRDYGYTPLPPSAYPTGTVIIVNGPKNQPFYERPAPPRRYPFRAYPYPPLHRPFKPHRR